MKNRDKVDTVTLDVPLLLRMLEYAKEDAKTDMDLHVVSEKMIALSKSKPKLTMSDYDRITRGTADIANKVVSEALRYRNKALQLYELFKDTAKTTLREGKETFVEFATTRMKGAQKISDSAHDKGGLSLLTWHHFKVKLPYYKKAAEGSLNMEKAAEEFKTTYEKISLDMTQTEFQREVGRLEVLGELLIRQK